MRLILTLNHDLKSDESMIGYREENKSRMLNIIIMDESLYDKWAYLEFQINNGAKYTTERLPIENGMINYILPNGLLYEEGSLKVQVIFRYEEDWVWKSSVKKFIVEKSICAGEDIAIEHPDLVLKLERVVEEVGQTQKELTGEVNQALTTLNTKLTEAEEVVNQALTTLNAALKDAEDFLGSVVGEINEKIAFAEQNELNRMNNEDQRQSNEIVRQETVSRLETEFNEMKEHVDGAIQTAIYDAWDGEY